MTECQHCGRDASRGVAGICPDCVSPEALSDRLDSLPEPLRGVMRRVGEDMGIVARKGPDQ
jgi:hypothetical protein